MKPRLGALLTHPIQYYSPWLRALAQETDLKVYYAYQQTAQGQANAGFGAAFEWDVPLLEGYDWQWLRNVAATPNVDRYEGCDTPEIAEILAREQFDAFLMFGWSYKCFLQGARAARRVGTPVLIRADSQLETPRPLLKKAVKAVTYPFFLPRLGHFMSPGTRTDRYLRHYGVPPSQIHRVPHMVDTERFASGAASARANGEAQALRAQHGVDAGDFVFMFCGKLIAKKRPILLLEGLKVLADRGGQASVKLWIVGDGPLRAELERYAADHELPVTFAGFANQSQLPGFYAAADCLVLPSDGEETWGLVVNEAFACGLPAIVSAEAGCSPELAHDGQTGWILRSPAAPALADLYATAVMNGRTLPRSAMAALTREGSYATGVERVLAIADRLARR